VSLSPVSAISDMVAPVVLMTLATIFASGLLTVAASIAENVVALSRERLGILRGTSRRDA
jgi:fumarate reductase subunit D